jgi:hypothetical protein
MLLRLICYNSVPQIQIILNERSHSVGDKGGKKDKEKMLKQKQATKNKKRK